MSLVLLLNTLFVEELEHSSDFTIDYFAPSHHFSVLLSFLEVSVLFALASL